MCDYLAVSQLANTRAGAIHKLFVPNTYTDAFTNFDVSLAVYLLYIYVVLFRDLLCAHVCTLMHFMWSLITMRYQGRSSVRGVMADYWKISGISTVRNGTTYTFDLYAYFYPQVSMSENRVKANAKKSESESEIASESESESKNERVREPGIESESESES